MKLKTLQKGFTLLEVMLALTLLAISVSMAVLYIQSSQARADVNANAAEFVSHARLSQSAARSGAGGTSHGIHLEQDSYTIFQGNVYDSLDTDNFTIDLPPTVQIGNINLNGGGSDIVFTAPEGRTTKYGSFTLSSSQINKTLTIEISSLGTINY